MGNLSSSSMEPNCKFNVDAKNGHAFGILMALLAPCAR